MKKIIFTAFALFFININLFAQTIEQDITYYKFINKLWTMSNAFDKVAFHLDNGSVEMEQTRSTELEVIDKLYADASQDYKVLIGKSYKESKLKSLEELLLAMEFSLVELKGKSWTKESSWQLNYNLVKMRLGELELKKSNTAQLTISSN